MPSANLNMKISANRIREFVSGARKRDEFVISKVAFIREQDGPSESSFKSSILPMLRRHEVGRSYLALTQYDGSSEFHVALCFSDSKSTELLVNEVMELFRTQFNREDHLDILFLNDLQQKEIERVCAPFYIRELTQ